jgi:hypothetical protein
MQEPDMIKLKGPAGPFWAHRTHFRMAVVSSVLDSDMCTYGDIVMFDSKNVVTKVVTKVARPASIIYETGKDTRENYKNIYLYLERRGISVAGSDGKLSLAVPNWITDEHLVKMLANAPVKTELRTKEAKHDNNKGES